MKSVSFVAAKLYYYLFFAPHIATEATSKIIEGIYAAAANGHHTSSPQAIIYAVFTTTQNAIPGSAICAFRIDDIMDAFDGRFKSQKDSTSNWLPIAPDAVPEPRPGKCVDDSRTLPSSSVNFIKMHTLMETSVPAMHGRPLLTRVNLKHLFTAITVDAQIKGLDGHRYDVIFVGTDDGRVIKIVSAANETNGEPIIVTETQALPAGQKVRELTVSHRSQSLIVVADGQIVSIPLYHCKKIQHCRDCVRLQDPYCAWDTRNHECVAIDATDSVREHYIQRLTGSTATSTINDLCRKHGEMGNWIDPPPVVMHSTRGTLQSVGRSVTGFENEITLTSIDGVELTNQINRNIRIDPLVVNASPVAASVDVIGGINNGDDDGGDLSGVTGDSLDGIETGALHMGSPSIIAIMCVLFVAGLLVGVIVVKLRVRLTPCYIEHHRSQINP